MSISLITKLQKTYVQKSRIFLYPALGIARGVSVTPIQTFLSWDKYYGIYDHKLICQYHMRADQDFKVFEERILLKNEYFEDWFLLNDDTGVYIFDFSDLGLEFDKIINGKYSKLSFAYKEAILKFFKNYKTNHAYLYSYLFPELYFDLYANLLNIDLSILHDVGELCSLPNLVKEKLTIKKKSSIFDASNNNLLIKEKNHDKRNLR